MGDRALVVCHKGRSDFSPAVYTHWNGHKVGELLDKAQHVMRKGDTSYASARLAGTFHENIKGMLGFGLLPAPASWEEATSEDYSHGDAGVFMVDVDTGLVECFNGYGFEDTKQGEAYAMTRQLTLKEER